MSTRAYKLIEIKTKKNATFSVSGNWEFVQAYGIFNNDGNGDILNFEREDIERGIKEDKNADNVELLKLIRKDMRKDDECIEYYCY